MKLVEVVAEVLAAGGPVDDEMDAARQVMDAVADQDWPSHFRGAVALACARGGARSPSECADLIAAHLTALLREGTPSEPLGFGEQGVLT